MTDQGYNATSVDQVIAESSSSKGAFFHHFSSKADLALQLVERYVAADLAHLDAGLAATADIDDPAARVVAFLRFYEDGADELMSEQSGCLYATVLAEREFTGSDINAWSPRPSRRGARRSSTCCARRWPPAAPASTSTSTPSPTTCSPRSRAASSCAARSRTRRRCAPSSGSSASWSRRCSASTSGADCPRPLHGAAPGRTCCHRRAR